MEITRQCPVCAGGDLETLFVKHVRCRSDDHAEYRDNTDDFRNSLMFRLILKTQEDVEISYDVCRTCGLVFSNPRCTDEDMAIKYREIIKYDTSANVETQATFDTSRVRSRKCERLLRRFTDLAGRRILDVGGATGKLLYSFVKNNDCYVLDFEKRRLIEGVSYLGRSIHELDGNPFDVMFMCHVVEHMVDPTRDIMAAREHLRDRGLLYVEVPFELRRNYQGFGNYITHINVFSAGSLEWLMARCGFRVRLVRTGPLYSNKSASLCVQCVGEKVSEPVAGPTDAYEQTIRALQSRHLHMRLACRLRNCFLGLHSPRTHEMMRA